MYRKVEGMLNNRSKLCWMKSHRQIRPWQNASATEDMLSTSQNDMNMQLQKQTERSWIEPVVWNQSFVLCFTDQMGSLPIWFTFSHIWIKQNYTFFFFFFQQNSPFQRQNPNFQKQHLSIYCTPLVHKNILGTLRFNKQQHFIIKKSFEYRHWRKTDEKRDIQMEIENF